MRKWQHQTNRFFSKGLSLLVPEDVPDGYFAKYTNVNIIQEGSISSRPGAARYTTTKTLTAGYVQDVFSNGTKKIALVNGNVWRETAAGSFINVGSANDFATDYCPRFIAVSPWNERAEDSWVYLFSDEACRRINMNGTAGTEQERVGLAPPNVGYSNVVDAGEQFHLRVSVIEASTSTVAVYSTESLNGRPFYTISEQAGRFIQLQKPTSKSENKPGTNLTITNGTLRTAFNATSGVGYANRLIYGRAVASRILTNTLSLGTYPDNSPFEAFVRLQKPSAVNELRLKFSLEPPLAITSMTVATTSDGFTAEFETTTNHNLQVGDDVTVQGAVKPTADGNWNVVAIGSATKFKVFCPSGGSLPTVTMTAGSNGANQGEVVKFSGNAYWAATEPSDYAEAVEGEETVSEAREKFAANFDIEEKIAEQRAQGVPEDKLIMLANNWRVAQGKTWETITQRAIIAGKGEWFPLSIRKDQFRRDGTDQTKNWDTIYAFRWEVFYDIQKTTDTESDFEWHQLDFTPAESGLDSWNGGLPYDWLITFYDSKTGVESNPCPIMPEGHFITKAYPTIAWESASAASQGADQIRIYRRGGSLAYHHLVDTIQLSSSVNTYQDLKDDLAIATAPLPKWDNDQLITTYEPATNFCKYSNDFENWTVATGSVTVQKNAGVAPDGSHTADRLIFNATGSKIRITYTGSNLDRYLGSIYLKADTLKSIYTAAGGLWGASGGGVNEYYWASNINNYGGEPDNVFLNGATMTKGTVGALADHEWGWGNGDALGYNTIYVADATGDPDVSGVTITYSYNDWASQREGMLEFECLNLATTQNYIKWSDYSNDGGVWERFSGGDYYANIGIGQPDTTGLELMCNKAPIEVLAWGAQLIKTGSGATAPHYPSYPDPPIITDGDTRTELVPRYANEPRHVWGPFLGRYLFAIKPQTNAGEVFYPGDVMWCKPYNPDAWPPSNRLRVTGKAEPLQNGCIYNGRAYVFSKERLYSINPDPTSQGNDFISMPTPCNIGLFAEDALTVGDYIYFVGKEGIYATNGGVPKLITEDVSVRPLFRPEGSANVNGYSPVKWTAPQKMRLEWQDPYLWFLYEDTSNAMRVLRYHAEYGRWEFFDFTLNPDAGGENHVRLVKHLENERTVMLGDDSGFLYTFGGTSTDASGQAVSSEIQTGYMDQGAHQDEKLYGDLMLEATIPVGKVVTLKYGLSNSPSVTTVLAKITSTVASNTRYIRSFGSGAGVRGRSIAINAAWSGTGSPVHLNSMDISYLPYDRISTNLSLDWDDLGVPYDKYVWGCALDVEYNGTGSKTLLIQKDGATYSTQTIPTSAARQVVELSWPVARGALWRILPSDTKNIIFHNDVKWYMQEEAPQISKWVCQWEDKVPGGDFYSYGIELECDTLNTTKTVVVERDGGTTIGTYSVNTNGHSTVVLSWPAVQTKTLRFRATDAKVGYLYKWNWMGEAEPPLMSKWDSNLNDDGNLEDKWISGLYLEMDTVNKTKSFGIWIDGTKYTTLNGRSSGTKPVKLSFGPVRGVTMRWTSTDSVGARVKDYRWIWEQEPVQLTNMATNWDNLGWPYEKLIKGYSIEADTLNATKTLQLRVNGSETGAPLTIANTTVGAQSIKFLGRNSKEFAFTDQVRARTVRLDPTDNNLGRLYKLQWIWDREPPLMDHWFTQEHSFNRKDYSFLVDAQITIRSTSTVSLIVNREGTNNTYSIASTSNLRRKKRVEFNPVKGKSFQFELQSSQPFYVYNEDTFIRVKSFRGGELQVYQIPFEGGAQNP